MFTTYIAIPSGGVLVPFKRNIFVPPFDVFEILVVGGTDAYEGVLTYTEHNLSRKKATKDETWDSTFFIDTVQSTLQHPEAFSTILFGISVVAETLQLEIKEKKSNGLTIMYNKPCVLSRSSTSIESIMATIITLESQKFRNLCRGGKLTKATTLYEKGCVDAGRFGEDGSEWSALLHAAQAGQRKVVVWLVDGLKLNLHSAFTGGWTALHLACKHGHYEVAKFLLERGGDLTAVTDTGETPISLMVKGGHKGMIEKFIGPGTTYTTTLVTGHGVRSSETHGMFTLMSSVERDTRMRAIEDAKNKATA